MSTASLPAEATQATKGLKGPKGPPDLVVTASIYDPIPTTPQAVANPTFRLLITRRWPRGFTRARGAFDGWCPDLAPSAALLDAWHGGALPWGDFAQRYIDEMTTPRDNLTLIAYARTPERATVSEPISATCAQTPLAFLEDVCRQRSITSLTLLCYERFPQVKAGRVARLRCHRHLLGDLMLGELTPNELKCQVARDLTCCPARARGQRRTTAS